MRFKLYWGKDFRTDFKELAKLKAVFPKSHMVGMTATATKAMQEEIQKTLRMKSVQTVATGIDRKNMKVNISRRMPTSGGKYSASDSFADIVKPYVTEVCRNPASAIRTIIYCKLKWCAEGYELANREALKSEKHEVIMSAISQVHAPCTTQMKKLITEDMASSSGKIKLLFATEAYGMGADSTNIDRIVHIGPPSSAETYIQEIGRAERDGREAIADLFFNSNDLGNKNIRDEMRDFCTIKACRRKYICDHFGSTYTKFDNTILNKCCDVCEKECQCLICICSRQIDDDSPCDGTLSVDESQRSGDEVNYLRQLLQAYFDAENAAIKLDNPALITGLDNYLIQQVELKYHMYISEEEIARDYPHLNKEFV